MQKTKYIFYASRKTIHYQPRIHRLLYVMASFISEVHHHLIQSKNSVSGSCGTMLCGVDNGVPQLPQNLFRVLQLTFIIILHIIISTVSTKQASMSYRLQLYIQKMFWSCLHSVVITPRNVPIMILALKLEKMHQNRCCKAQSERFRI